MSVLHWLEDSGGVMRDVTSRVLSFSWGASESAEEGAVASWSVVLSDPAADLAPGPSRRYIVEEDASALADHIIWWGWTAGREIGRAAAGEEQYTGRAWTVDLVSADSVWERRIMTAASCKRPAETDVARMQWLLATSEASLFGDVATWVSTASPVAMDAVDYRGQTFGSVADDCAQHSGKNWYAWAEGTAAAAVLHAWYGRDTLAVRDSALSLSNVASDMAEADLLAGTSLVWPISEDTALRIDPSRVYDGCYLPYDGGAVFRTATPRTVYRDFAAPSLNVKSSAKAAARALRYLKDMALEEDRITTSVELPAALATGIRAGMRVQFRASHLPGYESGTWCRVLTCSPSQVPGGYRLALELSGGTGTCAGATPSGFYPPLGSATSDATGIVSYIKAGTSAFCVPMPYFAGAWNYPTWHIAGGGSPSGWMDATGAALGNAVRMAVTGGGTATVYVTGGWDVGPKEAYYDVYLSHTVPGGACNNPDYTVVDWSSLGNPLMSGDVAITVTVPGNASRVCAHYIEVKWNCGTAPDGSGVGFAGFTWAASP